MKNYSVATVLAMGVLFVSGAAFAGTSANNIHGFACDTVVPVDSSVPTDTANVPTQVEPAFYAAATDTVVPVDTAKTDTMKSKTCPEK